MTNGFQPGKGTMEEHLQQLFHRTSTDYKFEIRCLHPSKDEHHKPRSRLFTVGQWSTASEYAEMMNQQGYNVYVTVNPLKHSTLTVAKDTEVAEARWQFIDIDSLRSPEDFDRSQRLSTVDDGGDWYGTDHPPPSLLVNVKGGRSQQVGDDTEGYWPQPSAVTDRSPTRPALCAWPEPSATLTGERLRKAIGLSL